MKKGTTTYSYDAMGNLLKVVLPDNRVITYKVDARGRRIGKYVNGVFKYGFVYNDQLNPIAKVDESGNIIEYYVYGLKSNIPEYVVKDNVKYKIISDHLGSPIEVRATTGGLPVLSCKYDSFGNIIEQNGDFELPFRFAGGIWDEDTKLIRFGVRDYDPEVGRWTSVEPLGFAGARNWYVYAGNDGVNYLDLDGRKEAPCGIPYEKINYKLNSLDYKAISIIEQLFCKGFNSNKEFIASINNSGNLNIKWGESAQEVINNYEYEIGTEAFVHGHGGKGMAKSGGICKGEIPSDADKDFAYQNGLTPLYLVTPQGHIYRWIPKLTYRASTLTGELIRLPNTDCTCPKNKKNSCY